MPLVDFSEVWSGLPIAGVAATVEIQAQANTAGLSLLAAVGQSGPARIKAVRNAIEYSLARQSPE